MPDFIPAPDDKFDTWGEALVTYLTADPDAPSLTTAVKNALTAGLAAWQTPYKAHVKAQIDANTIAQTKDDARTAFEALLAKDVGDIQRDDATTDTQRTAMQVTVPKAGRTSVSDIASYPVLTKTDTSTRLRHRLFFADSETPTTAAKPVGAQFCEIRMSLGTPGGTAPTDPNMLPQLAMESRAPHRNDFDPGDEGKVAYYAMRWLNTKGDPSPWSPIYTAVVPG